MSAAASTPNSFFSTTYNDKSKERQHKYYQTHKDEILKRQHIYQSNNREIINKRQREYYHTHPNNYRGYKRKRQNKLNDILYGFLGNKCVCTDERCWHVGQCNITNRKFLQFDHINGHGNEDRRRFGGRQYNLVSYYIEHLDEAKKTLQIMCANCNWGKQDCNHGI